jgi:hypothetical protein
MILYSTLHHHVPALELSEEYGHSPSVEQHFLFQLKLELICLLFALVNHRVGYQEEGILQAQFSHTLLTRIAP